MLYNVGDGVFADVPGFDPFPAVIESVVLNESLPCVYYHVKLLGSKQVVALDGENLLPFEENKGVFKMNYSSAELENGAKMRETVLLGKEDELPEVLKNFITVEEHFDEVSTEDMKRLGLSNIILSASDLIKNLENVSIHSYRPGNYHQEYLDDELIEVEEISWKESHTQNPQKQCSDNVSFPCNNCFKLFHSHTSLRKHKQRSKRCKSIAIKQTRNGITKRKKFLVMRAKRVPVQSRKKVKTVKNEDISDTGFLTSDDSSPDGKGGKHNEMERERRADLASKFTELSNAIGLKSNLSKVGILASAEATIRELMCTDSALLKGLNLLKDINHRLNARLLSLKSNVDF